MTFSSGCGARRLALVVAGIASSCATTLDQSTRDQTHFASPDASTALTDSGRDSRSMGRDARPSMPTGEVCPTPGPDPGAGLCPLPPPPCQKGALQACWDIPQAPAATECPPSAAAEYGTRCCVPGVCGFDYGSGCTAFPHVMPGQSATGFAACSGSTGSVERIYDATSTTTLSDVAVTDSFVYTFDGKDTTRLVAVSKATCAATPVYESTDYVAGLAAGSNAVYFVVRSSQIFWAQGDMQASPFVTLVPLFGPADVQLGIVGAAGDTAYVTAFHHESPDSGTIASLVAIPCCGNAAPSIIASDAAGSFGYDGQLVRDGNRIFMFGELFGLDSPNQLSLAYVDLGSRKLHRVFEMAAEPAMTRPLGVHGGHPYFAQPGQLTTVDVDTCASTAAVKDRLFDGVPAFASDDAAIYWAETYADLTVSRIFMKRDGAAEVTQVVEPSGQVTWTGVDATHLYWAEVFDPDGPNRRSAISRIALPK